MMTQMHCFAVTCLHCSSCWCGQECICGVTRSVFMLCCNVAERLVVLNADAFCWTSATSLLCRGHVCKYCNCNTVWQQTSTEQAIQLFLYCPACCWHLYRKKQTATIFKLHSSCALPPCLCWDENLSTPPKVWCYLFVQWSSKVCIQNQSLLSRTVRVRWQLNLTGGTAR